MKRSILLIFTLFFVAISNAEIRVGDNQKWWGYFSESDADKLPYDGCLGYSTACTIDAAIRIPASEEIVGGSTINAIRFWLGNDISAINSSLKVWISTTRPSGSTLRSDYRQVVAKSALVSGLNEIELTTPFEVKHQEIYVGYTFSISKKSYPVMSYGDDVPDGFFYRVDNGDWNDFYGTGYGKLALQVLIESESFPTNCIVVEDFGQNMVLQKKTISIPITILNKGSNPVKSIAYTISSKGGETSAETTKSFGTSPMNANTSKTFNVTFQADEEARKYQKYFTVTKVNGEENTATYNTGTGFLITLTEKQAVTPVIEEFTGTWCGWCPRGTVGMEKVHEAYGDQVVQIAAHYSDPMAISEYQSVINAYAGGFPNSITDRQYEADPSFSGLKSVLTTAFKRIPLGAIELSAEWNDEQQKAVVFNTKTKFSYNEEDGNFAIAYVLVEDGLTGTGTNWAQTNYYSGSGTGDMAWWGSQGSPVSGVEYNHVAVAAWSAKDGVKNSVNQNIIADEEQRYTYTGTIPTKSLSLIQDKSRLKAIALLIDKTDGTIVNAAQSDIAFATGIPTVDNGQSSMFNTATFDLSGRKLSTTQKGINIIRMNDGTVKKVLVK